MRFQLKRAVYILVILLGLLFILRIKHAILYIIHLTKNAQLQAKLRPKEYHVSLGAFDVGKFFYNTSHGSLRSEFGRELPDTRNTQCKAAEFVSTLRASVVIVYQNEALATLLNAIYSILQRSPPSLLTEIIVIDDFSQNGNNLRELTEIPGVKVFRNEKKGGIIPFKNNCAESTSGDVLLFMTSNCEVNVGWLEPLLYRISQNPYTIVSPVLDMIDSKTNEYAAGTEGARGGFDWILQFRWEVVPNYNDTKDYIRSPVVFGGVFGASKEWFTKLGRFDPGLVTSEGDNIELCLKSWLCGGSVEIIQCSRVGYIFPSQPPDSNSKDSLYLRNIKRIADVWLEEYKRFFYHMKPSARFFPETSIAERRSLKKQLKCRNFKWFLETVYPELRLPVTDEILFGKISQAGVCLDVVVGQAPAIAKLLPCREGNDSQTWSWNKSGVITNGIACLTADPIETHGYVMLRYCLKECKSQMWSRKHEQIVLADTEMCMDSYKAESGIVIAPCHELLPSQQWHFGLQT
ncbi:hypothetical protein CHS0354_013803 [Potamilus streckersoni]|uniref:Polypeptide N-acetylgalactosaminyltransferase n=1 Tax=Potamilus streckersoni TaxID=2493646 RepID=A0AAE0SH62_9BIVA|nr:hypothetical protein CHS0354_013803 [Potamilus streckersoni]